MSNLKLLPDFRHYLKKEGCALPTLREYQRDAQAFLIWLAKDVSTLNRSDFEKFLSFLAASGRQPKTVSRCLSALKGLSRFLFSRHLTRQDFAAEIRHPHLPPTNLRTLTENEIERLRSTVSQSARGRALLETLLQTGITISEIVALRLSDVTLIKGPQYGKLRIRSINPDRNRTIPINNRLEAVLDVYSRSRIKTRLPFLFLNRSGRCLGARVLRLEFEKLFRKSRLDRVMVNDLRNTFIIRQLEKGTDPGRVAALVGFKNLASLNRFLKIAKKRKTQPGVVEEV